MKAIHLLLFVLTVFAVKAQRVSFEPAQSFYLNNESLQRDSIAWGYLKVPENWENLRSDTIKVAVAVLKNSSRRADADAVVFIQGGPGASGIQNIGMWRGHPLRKKHDIVLLDIRGTGFSVPRLCPDLGRKIMGILATNQSEESDEKQKAAAALSCKQDLLNRGVDIDAYHSMSVSKDLHALKDELGYKGWHVYGASYGTYMAQLYASAFPDDVRTLVLDSFISDISTYYTQNTSNYMNSLARVFELCENNAGCNRNYPSLEAVYYHTIQELENNPITVSVDRSIVPSGEFTFNAEDFKISIQQALYHKQLVEVIPLLIYQFKDRNKEALGNLVAAFSSLLGMDYGIYFCVSCNEVLPNNDYALYQKDASQYDSLNGGISFYKSDFEVCDRWNIGRDSSAVMHHKITELQSVSFPVLIFSGEYDPITPASNVAKEVEKLEHVYALNGLTYGHVPGFSRIGRQVAASFIEDPSQKPGPDAFKNAAAINFANDVTINRGVSKMGNSLSRIDFVFLFPLFMALPIIVVFIVAYMVKLLRKEYRGRSDRMIRFCIVFTSIIGITGVLCLVRALMTVADQNQFILAFGLPERFDYIFTILSAFAILLAVTSLFFVVRVKKINDRSVFFTVLFSNLLLVIYLAYWGVL